MAGHSSAITFVAVRPDFKMGRVFRGWHSGKEITTAAMVVDKVMEMSTGLNIASIRYDWACADFYTIAQGMGLYVEPAEKGHSIGESTANVLLRTEMLAIYDLPELEPLHRQLLTVRRTTAKRSAIDDAVDSFRYSVSSVPWDFSDLSAMHRPKAVFRNLRMRLRKQEMTPELDLYMRRTGTGDYSPEHYDNMNTVEDELKRMNELMYS